MNKVQLLGCSIVIPINNIPGDKVFKTVFNKELTTWLPMHPIY